MNVAQYFSWWNYTFVMQLEPSLPTLQMLKYLALDLSDKYSLHPNENVMIIFFRKRTMLRYKDKVWSLH